MADLPNMKSILEARATELKSMIAEIEDQLDDPVPSNFSEQAIVREGDEVLESRAKAEYQELKAIEAALARIENDVYGNCLECGENISDERLEAVPHAVYCRNCMTAKS